MTTLPKSVELQRQTPLILVLSDRFDLLRSLCHRIFRRKAFGIPEAWGIRPVPHGLLILLRAMVIQSEIASGGDRDLGMVIQAIAGTEVHPRIGGIGSMAILPVIRLDNGAVDDLTESSLRVTYN